MTDSRARATNAQKGTTQPPPVAWYARQPTPGGHRGWRRLRERA